MPYNRCMIIFPVSMILFLGGCFPVQGTPTENVQMTLAQEQERQMGLYLSMASADDWSRSDKGKMMEDALVNLQFDANISIKLYDRNRLGSGEQMIEAARIGTVDIVQIAPSAQVAAVPQAALWDMPGTFEDLHDWNTLFMSRYRNQIQMYYHSAGLQLLDIYAYSWREMSSSKPVRNLSDLQGMNVGTAGGETAELLWKSLGAKPERCQLSELYHNLREGIMDGQENLMDTMLSEKLVEVQKYVTLTKHQPAVSVIVMNLEKYNSMTEEQQMALQNFITDFRDMIIKQMPEMERETEETLIHDYEIAVIEPDDRVKQAIRTSGSMIVSMLQGNISQDDKNVFLQMVEQIRGK